MGNARYPKGWRFSIRVVPLYPHQVFTKSEGFQLIKLGSESCPLPPRRFLMSEVPLYRSSRSLRASS